MKADVKEKWLTALRSGKYKQGRHNLASKLEGADEMEYCCLGVLCELAVAAGVTRVSPHSLAGNVYNSYGDDHEALLPPEVATWAELATNPETSVPRGDDLPGESYTLAGLNDEGHSFSAIADVIEAGF